MRTIPLDGTWQLTSPETPDTSYPAPVPGSVHDALLAAGSLPDAHFGYDERGQMWVSDQTWVYRRSFDVDAALLAASRVELVCEGLDTLCVGHTGGSAYGVGQVK